MLTIGMVSFAQLLLKPGAPGIFRPVATAKRLYAPTVTSVCPIQKPLLMVTRWDGFSSAEQSVPPGEQPIIKVPGAIQTY